MMRNKMMMIICFFSVAGFCFFVNALSVNAIAGKSEKAITLKKFSVWDNGVTIEQERAKETEKDEITINANTLNKEEGYYSVYLYENKVQNLSRYDAITFFLGNISGGPLQMNFSVTVNKETSAELRDGAKVILEEEESGEGKIISVTYGTFQIPSDFNGRVYIPFSELKNEDKEELSVGKVNSWGITLVMEQEQETMFAINDMKFLEDSYSQVKEQYVNINILGTNQIELADTGKVIKDYSGEATDLDGDPLNRTIEFSLAGNVKGASITNTGRLEVDSFCTAPELIIKARAGDSSNTQELAVQLVKGSEGEKEVKIPGSEEVPGIMPFVYTFLIEHILLFRIVFIVIAYMLAAIIFTWLRYAIKEQKVIRQSLKETKEEAEE